MKETILTLKGIGLPPLSAGHCTQTLEALSLGKFYRTVNGDLLYTGDDTPQKYITHIKGKDKYPAGLDSLVCGQLVQVGCIVRLWQEGRGEIIHLGRTAVEGSILAINTQQKVLSFSIESPTQIRLLSSEKAYISYRPLLEMRLIEMNLFTNEWESENEWSLKLEEV